MFFSRLHSRSFFRLTLCGLSVWTLQKDAVNDSPFHSDATAGVFCCPPSPWPSVTGASDTLLLGHLKVSIDTKRSFSSGGSKHYALVLCCTTL